MNDKANNKYDKLRRGGAIAGVVVLLAMVAATFVLAFVHFPGSDRVFLGMLILDLFVPLLIWGYLSIIRWAKRKDAEMTAETERLLKENNKNS